MAENTAKILAGFRGGLAFNNPVKFPSLRFVDGHPPAVKAKIGPKKEKEGSVGNAFGSRRG